MLKQDSESQINSLMPLALCLTHHHKPQGLQESAYFGNGLT